MSNQTCTKTVPIQEIQNPQQNSKPKSPNLGQINRNRLCEINHFTVDNNNNYYYCQACKVVLCLNCNKNHQKDCVKCTTESIISIGIIKNKENLQHKLNLLDNNQNPLLQDNQQKDKENDQNQMNGNHQNQQNNNSNSNNNNNIQNQTNNNNNNNNNNIQNQANNNNIQKPSIKPQIINQKPKLNLTNNLVLKNSKPSLNNNNVLNFNKNYNINENIENSKTMPINNTNSNNNITNNQNENSNTQLINTIKQQNNINNKKPPLNIANKLNFNGVNSLIKNNTNHQNGIQQHQNNNNNQMEEELPQDDMIMKQQQQQNYLQNENDFLDKNRQMMVQQNLNKYIDKNMEEINEMRNQLYKHKDREIKRFQEFKKILEQSVKQFLQDLKKSYEQHFKEKFEVLNNIVKEFKDNLQPLSQVCDMSHSELKSIEDYQFKHSQSILKIKTFIQSQMPIFSIKTEYLTEIKEKIIHYMNMKFPSTKSWPKFDRPGQSDMVVSYYCPEKSGICLYDPKNQKFDFRQYASDTLNEQLPLFCQPIYHQEGTSKRLFLIGGLQYDQQLNYHIPSHKNYVIDLNTGEVKRIADSLQPKSKQCLVKIQKEIYSIGGVITQNRIRCQTCEKYDIVNDKWEEIPPMTQLRVMPQGCFMQNKGEKRLYIFGGITDEKRIQKSIEYYDLNKKVWVQENVQNKNFYIAKHSGYAVNIGLTDILLIGGYSFCQAMRSKNIQIYNIITNQITDFGDILPIGIARDGRGGDVNYMKNSIFILNGIQSQIYETMEQRISEITVTKVNNQFASISDMISINQLLENLNLQKELNTVKQRQPQIQQLQQSLN